MIGASPYPFAIQQHRELLYLEILVACEVESSTVILHEDTVGNDEKRAICGYDQLISFIWNQDSFAKLGKCPVCLLVGIDVRGDLP